MHGLKKLGDQDLASVRGGLALQIGEGKVVVLFGPNNAAPKPGNVKPRSNIFAAQGLDDGQVIAIGGHPQNGAHLDGLNGWI